ncbi:hypothetical protein [Hamadaea tsunoensis]|uniref:hypothetical protein n=1 Tax=Hamadaea tsunoensis TaxID=53368 RepID=UPI0004128631|nr:hypothetical protein [Hamadaea tsunoensis]
MTTVTADDVRALAQSADDQPVLALVDGEIVILPEAEVSPQDRVLFTQAALIEDLGVDVTEVEAELLAGRLTADITEVDVDVVDAGGTAED